MDDLAALLPNSTARLLIAAGVITLAFALFVVVDKVVSLACSVVKLLQLQQIIEPTSL
jgi:hypothetical protein